MKPDKIIAIDPGAGGGIVICTNSSIQSHKMPTVEKFTKKGKKRNETDINALQELIKSEKTENTIVFLEKVQAWTGKDSVAKQHSITKLLANFEHIKTVVLLQDIKMIEITPQEWQKGLRLYVKGDSYTERKKRFHKFATNQFKDQKVTAWNQDGFCILRYAIICINDKIWQAKYF